MSLSWRLALIIGLACAFSESKCRSIPINQKIEEQKTKNEKAKEIAKKYVPVGELLDAVTGALDGSSNLLQETNKEREKEKAAKEEEKQRADKNAKDARIIFWGKIIGGVILAGLAIYGLKAAGSKIPLIGRFFGG